METAKQTSKMLKVGVLVSDLETRRKIINSIKMYRAVARKCFAGCAMAEQAGAEIIATETDVTVKPQAESAKRILAESFGVDGKAHLYEMRLWLKEFCPTWMSIVPESIHRDIVSPRWKSKDPEFPKATRGYLLLNGARAFAQFQNIGIYFKNTVPKIAERTISLKWDYDIGEVEFKVIDMDGSRWSTWKRILSKEYKLGGMYLKLIDGKLFLNVTYTPADLPSDLDPEKPLFVEFTDCKESFIAIRTDRTFSGEFVNVTGELAHAAQLEAIRNRYISELASYNKVNKRCGGRNGFRSVARKSACLTKRRSNFVTSSNHLFTRRIAEAARRNKSGKVIVLNCPEREMFGTFWNWSEFRNQLKYKIGDMGGVVTYETLPELSAATA